MTYEEICPPCGTLISGEDRDEVADAVIRHAKEAHDHVLTREHVLAHLDGGNPHAGEG